MAATSCQKESLAEMQLISEENITVYSVQYTIDGVPYAETLRSDEAYDALMQRLVALARNGCVVMVYDGNRQTSQLATKAASWINLVFFIGLKNTKGCYSNFVFGVVLKLFFVHGCAIKSVSLRCGYCYYFERA